MEGRKEEGAKAHGLEPEGTPTFVLSSRWNHFYQTPQRTALEQCLEPVPNSPRHWRRQCPPTSALQPPCHDPKTRWPRQLLRETAWYPSLLSSLRDREPSVSQEHSRKTQPGQVPDGEIPGPFGCDCVADPSEVISPKATKDLARVLTTVK